MRVYLPGCTEGGHGGEAGGAAREVSCPRLPLAQPEHLQKLGAEWQAGKQVDEEIGGGVKDLGTHSGIKRLQRKELGGVQVLRNYVDYKYDQDFMHTNNAFMAAMR